MGIPVIEVHQLIPGTFNVTIDVGNGVYAGQEFETEQQSMGYSLLTCFEYNGPVYRVRKFHSERDIGLAIDDLRNGMSLEDVINKEY